MSHDHRAEQRFAHGTKHLRGEWSPSAAKRRDRPMTGRRAAAKAWVRNPLGWLVMVTPLWSCPYLKRRWWKQLKNFIGFHSHLIPMVKFLTILICMIYKGIKYDFLLFKFHLIWTNLQLALVRAVRSKFVKEDWALTTHLMEYWGSGMAKKRKMHAILLLTSSQLNSDMWWTFLNIHRPIPKCNYRKYDRSIPNKRDA